MGLNVNDLVRADLLHLDDRSASHPVRSLWVLRQLVRLRYQLTLGAMAAVLVPSFMLSGSLSPVAAARYISPTQLGALLAFLLGFYMFRNVASFPGVRAISFIGPSFGAAYLIVGLLLWALQIDFRHAEFGLSFLTTVTFFLVVFFLVRRVRRPAFAVIPGGRVEALFSIGTVDWSLAISPADCAPHMPLVADLRADLRTEWLRFIADAVLAGRPVYNFKQTFESITGRVQIEHMSENIVGALEPNQLYASAKLYVDVIAAALALIFVLPLLCVIALAVRCESKGPAIFRQTRMGYQGRPFTIYKIRTMRILTAEEEERNRHYHDAHRISRLGAFLRRSRLDELPQLINIVRGEMSWIGPRPEAMSLSMEYEANLPFYRYRHVVRPGIAGWAQVNQGHVVGIEDAKLKLQFDFFYIKNFSLWLDLLVVLKTAKVILIGSGAR